jgi:hypothetical protein
MHSPYLRATIWLVLTQSTCAWAQQTDSCATLMNFKASGVEITKAVPIAAGSTEPNPYGQGHSSALPPYCRVEGVINRRVNDHRGKSYDSRTTKSSFTYDHFDGGQRRFERADCWDPRAVVLPTKASGPPPANSVYVIDAFLVVHLFTPFSSLRCRPS